MLSFLQTLVLTIFVVVLSHEADAIVTDWFEETTGTEMRILPVAKAVQEETADTEEQVTVTVMPVHTNRTKSISNKISIANAYNVVVSFGGGTRTASVLPDISPARL